MNSARARLISLSQTRTSIWKFFIYYIFSKKIHVLEVKFLLKVLTISKKIFEVVHCLHPCLLACSLLPLPLLLSVWRETGGGSLYHPCVRYKRNREPLEQTSIHSAVSGRIFKLSFGNVQQR